LTPATSAGVELWRNPFFFAAHFGRFGAKGDDERNRVTFGGVRHVVASHPPPFPSARPISVRRCRPFFERLESRLTPAVQIGVNDFRISNMGPDGDERPRAEVAAV
jgi:hypothetical protein